jgi:hypothetical protein
VQYEPPSEEYLIAQREILFRDEWLFYGLLLTLFLLKHWYIMVPVVILGATFVLVSYHRQWAMEAQRFGPPSHVQCNEDPDLEVD